MIALIARRLRWTDGQVYTAAIGIALALVLGISAVPTALGTHTRIPLASVIKNRPPSTAKAAPVTRSPSVAVSRPARSPIAGAPLSPTATPPATPDVTAGPSPVSPFGMVTTFATIGAPGAPGALAVGPDGAVYVSTDNGTARGVAGASHVFGYSATGAPASDITMTGQPTDHARGVAALAIAPDGRLAAVDFDSGRVTSVDPATGQQAPLATIPDLAPCVPILGPTRCEPGLVNHKPAPGAAVFDRAGNLFVTDSGQGTIWRLRPGQTSLDPWYQSIDFATGDGPAGVAIAPDGKVWFTVGSALDTAHPGTGGLYALAVIPDGRAGTRSLITAFATDTEPGALAVGSSGTAYVVLRGPGQIVTVAPGGSQQVLLATPGPGAIPLDGPAALAVTAGQLLVANQSVANVAAHWAVLAVSIRDEAVQ